MEPALPLPETSWQLEWARNLRSAEDLVEAGLVPPERAAGLDRVLKKFKFSLPRYYAELIDPKNPKCPIRLQAIPALEELIEVEGFKADPLSDLEHQPAPRITHRYQGRALFHLTPNCSLYCRYCFRKSLLNELRTDLFGGDFSEPLGYLAEHPEVEEVILSGGDPFLVTDLTLRHLISALAALPHVKRLRIHTRVPVTFPARVTDALARAIASTRLPVVLVTHFNHGKEITEAASAACSRLKQVAAMMLNQSVLLKDVNDSRETLAELSEKLFEIGILPYYLHHPDRAAGTAHFDVSRERGLQIHHDLRARLSGYLVPRYVVDEVGFLYKRGVGDSISSL